MRICICKCISSYKLMYKNIHYIYIYICVCVCVCVKKIECDKGDRNM